MSGNNPQSNANRFQAALAKWHNDHKNSGNPQDDLKALDAQINSHQNIKAFLNSLGKGTVVDPAVADALIAKWKSDPQFLDNLDKKLGGDGVAQQLREELKDPKNTQTLIAVINAVGQEAAPAPVAVAAAPAASSPPPTPSATQPTAPPPAGGHGAGGRAHAGAALNNHIIIEYADELAKTAATYGIPADQIHRFQEAINRRPELREKISAHLEKNHDLVVALNNFNKIDGRDVPPPYGDAVKAKMIEILENPDNLADPNFTSSFTSNVASLGQMVPARRGPGRTAGPAPVVGGASPMGSGRTGGFDFSSLGAGFQGAFGGIGDLFNSGNLGKLKDMLMGLLNQLGSALKSLFGGSGLLSMTGGPREDGPRMSAHVAPAGSKPPTAVDPNTGTVTGGPRVDGLGPQHRRLPGAGAEAAPGGVNGPTRVA